VQQAEYERDDPRKSLRQAGFSLPAANDFRRHEHDAERDRRFDGRSRHVNESESRAGEGETMCEGKGRDRRNEPARSFHQHQQREHEQQMVDAAENVLDAEHQVRAGDRQHARCGLHHE
jgi:hypothetical protein